MRHKLAIVTVVYENYTVLADLLESLKKQLQQNFYLLCIDVSINKQSINYGSIPGETVIAENKGYAHGVNVGLKMAIQNDYTHFCILNNDVYFKSNFTQHAMRALTRHPSSIIGGKIYYAPGYEYHKDNYRRDQIGKIIWYAGGTMNWADALTPHTGVDQVDSGQFDEEKQTEFVNGALMLFDKTVIEKIGFWDEGYFLYFEDADFCVRATNAGIPLWYDPSVVIWHKNAQSTGGSGSQLHRNFQRKNRLRFGIKYAPLRTKLHLVKNYLRGR